MSDLTPYQIEYSTEQVQHAAEAIYAVADLADNAIADYFQSVDDEYANLKKESFRGLLLAIKTLAQPLI